ncbi:MAG: tetratricopeptide repeat protein [bacterium]
MSGHIVYGQALYEAGRMPESRGVFETALGLDPENLIALRHLGDIAGGQGDYASARQWYVRVLDADPRNEEIQALISTLDAQSPPADDSESLVSFDLPSRDLGVDIEKEVAPFEPDTLPAHTDFAPASLSLADTAPAGVPVIPPSPDTPVGALIEEFSLLGFAEQPHSAPEEHDHSAPAEGLESTAFMPPDEYIQETSELDDSLDSGVPSFSAPAERIESLAGLQGSGGIAHDELHHAMAQHEVDEMAPLDLDDGLLLPPHGDPLAHDAQEPADEEPAPSEDSSAGDLPFFDAPLPDVPAYAEAAHDDASVVEPGQVDAEEPVSSELSASDDIPAELPPEVIAAEAQLIDAGETPAPDEAVARQPFVTETMAELYLSQGFPEQALGVYTMLLSASPDDARLSGLVASLTPEESARDTGPNVRDFFARLANRRPGAREAGATPPAADDFAPDPVADAAHDAVLYSEDATELVAGAEPEVHEEADSDSPIANPHSTLETVAPAIERAAAIGTPNGSIDALFGNRLPGTLEDSAASALAQAFGGEAEVPPMIAGRPAHAASGELSLDSVFRDGPARPPRTSQSFSFDQFFTGAGERSSGSTPQRTSSELPMPGDTPAQHSADDIEQFNSWLQGLKQR